jgi:hypothetical protein
VYLTVQISSAWVMSVRDLATHIAGHDRNHVEQIRTIL